MITKKAWFRRKRYGWGWTPATWQGWSILVLYAACVVGIFRSIDSTSHSGSDTLIGVALPFIVLSVILFGICYATGEKPRWQWGKDKEVATDDTTNL